MLTKRQQSDFSTNTHYEVHNMNIYLHTPHSSCSKYWKVEIKKRIKVLSHCRTSYFMFNRYARETVNR